ncbi:cyclase family protein [Spirosoma foliorum]|uniref:Kynurenine formamidase n=1 Tax=Spirosoma foliorum TaxID=2710596 RepID=A0A7G5H0D6_9BACT|nr:cyclase family protein [Spirosoma foliorum]QMW04578.1 cyclase family protein [Spirosoma foliorum]
MINGDPIDISVTLCPSLPTWPGSIGVQTRSLHTIGPNSDANVSRLDMDVHTGTHLDAPLHFVNNGADTSSFLLTTLIGACRVVSIPDTDTITRELLEHHVGADVPKRLLLRTDNSLSNWEAKPFRESFTALAADAAEWIVEKQIQLVGIDYLSIQRYADSPATHQILLRNRIIILEGIYLGHVEPNTYQLICLPLKVQGIEGVPCRAILYQN